MTKRTTTKHRTAMSELKDLHKPNLDRKLYSIEVTAYENAHTFSIHIHEEGYNLQYPHIIGVLEVVKGSYLRECAENAKAALSERESGKEETP